MTTNEVNILKELMLREFARYDERMTTFEANLARTDAMVGGIRETVAAMDVKLTGFNGVIERLERSVQPLEEIAAIMTRGKKWWGFVALLIVLLQIVVRSLPPIPWPAV